MDRLSSFFDGGLTAGQIAGIIAASIFIVRILLSFIWPLILVGLLKEKETAVTWSVVTKTIYNSWWPRVVGSDATATQGVRRAVNIISWCITLTGLLLSITAIVTPLGLHEAIQPENTPTPVPFGYVADTSLFGSGTMPRSSLGFSRICREGLAACPNSHNGNITWGYLENGTLYATAPDGYDTRIAQDEFDYLSSGATQIASTVSSVFDIQWRTYANTTSPNATSILDIVYTPSDYYDNGSTYLVGSYQPLTSLILEESWMLIEGLLVDMKSGGVGFRNHTVPFSSSPYSVSWSEDILFIEPVTECVDLNITIDFTLASSVIGPKAYIGNPAIADHGGFFGANKTLPVYNHSDGQSNPGLAFRAYQGAWLTNALTMALYNITDMGSEVWEFPFSYLDSYLGAEFMLPSDNYSGESETLSVSLDGINTDNTFSSWLTGAFEKNQSGVLNIPPNPFQVNLEDYGDIGPICSETYFSNLSADTGVVSGICGLLIGAPYRKDNSSSVLLEIGTNWTTPVYNCASATRAIIKTVNFTFTNQTSTASVPSLAGLGVTAINPKVYSSSSEYPLWAVEQGHQPAWTLDTLRPLWGLVSHEDDRFENLAYLRSPQLWLSGDATSQKSHFLSPNQNLAAVDFPPGALSCAYDVQSGAFNSICGSVVGDYSGSGDVQLYNLWRNLSRTSSDASRILNLIWTDIAANAVVGTKGWVPSPPQTDLAPSSSSSDEGAHESSDASSATTSGAMVPIILSKRVVKYHLPYATPAFVVGGILAFAILACLLLTCLRRSSPRRLKRYLLSLSSGRLMTTFLRPHDSPGAPEISETGEGKHKAISTKKWLMQDGKTLVNLSKGKPRIESDELNDDNDEAMKAMLAGDKAETGTSIALSDITHNVGPDSSKQD